MLIGVFIAVFLVGCLYYVVGIAETIAHREGMQDAADTAAFSAAVLHARGMNTLVLINLLMAALLAVLVALKLAEAALLLATIVMLGMLPFQPWLGGVVAGAEATRAKVRAAHDQLREPIHLALESLNALSAATRDSVPLMAQAAIDRQVTARYRPPADRVLLLPGSTTLPTEDGPFDELCGKAGERVATLTRLVLPLAVPPLDELITGAVSDLTRSGAGWFCGSDGALAPSTTVTYDVMLPELPSRAACGKPKSDLADARMQERLQACQRAEHDEERARPDPTTGACRVDCGPDGLYALRARLARRDCAPSRRDELFDFQWRQRTMAQSYRWQGQRLTAIGPARELDSVLITGAGRRPCGGNGAAVDASWNDERIAEDGSLQPVCSDLEQRARPTRPARGRTALSDEIVSIEYIEVTDVLACTREETRTFEVDGGEQDRIDGTPSRRDRSKAHQNLKPEIELGEAPLQIRAIASGTLPRSAPDRVISTATWRHSPHPHGELLELGRLSGAQAEYYYEVRDPERPRREEFMWNMRWRARLRRLAGDMEQR